MPVYDGVGVPDEPYRYVTSPAGVPGTADPTEATASTPVRAGLSVNGLVVSTAEQGPQLSLFVPPQSLAAQAGPIALRATPQAPADEPVGKRISGNVYEITFTSPAGPVTTTARLANASLYLRAPNGSDGWVMEYRPQHGARWQGLKTDRGGTDSHVSSFEGAGEYALAKSTSSSATASGGVGLLPWLIGAAVAGLALLVLSIRLRAAAE